MEKKLSKKTCDKILTTAYFIVLNVFKKNISTRQSMASKTLKYSSLSSSDKAKCNDLVQKVLRFTVCLDPWINKNKKGRLRVELFCLLRLALTDIFLRNVRQEIVLKKYSDLAYSFERTKYSKDKLRYFIHLGYLELKKKSLNYIDPPIFYEFYFQIKIVDQKIFLSTQNIQDV